MIYYYLIFSFITIHAKATYNTLTLRLQNTRDWSLYLLDCAFSVGVVGTLVVFVWRGVWMLFDIYLFPENPEYSAVGSLVRTIFFESITNKIMNIKIINYFNRFTLHICKYRITFPFFQIKINIKIFYFTYQSPVISYIITIILFTYLFIFNRSKPDCFAKTKLQECRKTIADDKRYECNKKK